MIEFKPVIERDITEVFNIRTKPEDANGYKSQAEEEPKRGSKNRKLSA